MGAPARSIAFASIALVACGLDLVGLRADGGDIADGAAPPAPVVDAAQPERDADATAPCSTDLATDPASCGACGHGCLGGACVAGVCQPVAIASGLGDPVGLAVAGDTIYWASHNGNAIHGATLTPSGTVGDAVVITTPHPRYVAVAGGDIYWTQHDDGGSVLARAIAGGVVRTIASNQSHPAGIAVVGADVYWAEQYADSLWRAVGGANPTLIKAGGLCFDEGVAADTTSLFVAASCGGIFRLDRDGMGSKNLAPFGEPEWPSGVAVDDERLYVAFYKSNKVAWLPKAGGPLTDLATAQEGAMGVAVDARAVYWVNRGSDTIMRLAK